MLKGGSNEPGFLEKRFKAFLSVPARYRLAFAESVLPEVQRSGHSIAGVDPGFIESVFDHSLSMEIMAAREFWPINEFSREEKIALIRLVARYHDITEAIITDITVQDFNGYEEFDEQKLKDLFSQAGLDFDNYDLKNNLPVVAKDLKNMLERLALKVLFEFAPANSNEARVREALEHYDKKWETGDDAMIFVKILDVLEYLDRCMDHLACGHGNPDEYLHHLGVFREYFETRYDRFPILAVLKNEFDACERAFRPALHT